MDIFDIQSDQRTGSQAQHAQKHDDDEVSQCQNILSLSTEMTDQAIVFIDC